MYPQLRNPDAFEYDESLYDFLPIEVQNKLKYKWSQFRTHFHTRRPFVDDYIFRFEPYVFHKDELEKAAWEVFSDLTHVSRINASYSYLLRHIWTGEIRVFYASRNNSLLLSPYPVDSYDRMKVFIDRLLEYNYEQIMNEGESSVGSSWTFEFVLGASFFVYKLGVKLLWTL